MISCLGILGLIAGPVSMFTQFSLSFRKKVLLKRSVSDSDIHRQNKIRKVFINFAKRT